MEQHLFNDRLTRDTALKKVFSRHHTVLWMWLCAAPLSLIYIIYIYYKKCHKRYRPLFAGFSSVTVSNCFLSSVTTFLILGTTSCGLLSSVLCPHLATL